MTATADNGVGYLSSLSANLPLLRSKQALSSLSHERALDIFGPNIVPGGYRTLSCGYHPSKLWDRRTWELWDAVRVDLFRPHAANLHGL